MLQTHHPNPEFAKEWMFPSSSLDGTLRTPNRLDRAFSTTESAVAAR